MPSIEEHPEQAAPAGATTLGSAAKASRRDEVRYRRLVESNIIAVITANMRGEVLDGNDAFLQMVGYTREELQAGAIRWDRMIPPEQLPRAAQAVEQLRATGVASPWETDWIRKDGTRVPVLIGVALLPDEAEETTIAFVVDLTERRRAQEAQARQLHQLQHIYHLTEAVGRATEVQEIYAEALDVLHDIAGADRAAVILCDPDGVPRFKAWRGLSDEYRQRVAGRYPWFTDSQDPRPGQVPDAQGDPALSPLHEAFAAEGIGALAFIPLLYGGRLLGKLMLYSNRPRHFGDEEMQLAQTVAGHVAFAIGRHRFERALRASEERFRTLSLSAPIGIFELDAQGRCTYVNPRWSEITGVPPERGLGLEWLETIHPEDRAMIERAREQTVRDGSEWSHEIRLQTPSGVRWVRVRGAPVHDSEGHITGYVGSIEDVTESRRTRENQQFIAHAGEELAASLEHAGVLQRIAELAVPYLADICVAEEVRDGRLHNAATASADPAKLAVLREIERRYRFVPRSTQGLVRVLRAGKPRLYRSVPAGAWRAVALDSRHLRLLRRLGVRSGIIAPLIARGRTLGAILFGTAESGRVYGAADVALAEELTRRAALALDNARLYQEAQEANQAKDQFLAVLSHELRNPLAPILAGMEILRRAAPDEPRVQRTVTVVERSVKLQARLVNDLLDLSRIRRGKIQLQRAPVVLDAVVESAVQAMQADADEAGLTLQVHVEPDLWVYGDFDRLQQVVMNLLSNAIKFTPAGGQIQVEAWECRHGAGGLTAPRRQAERPAQPASPVFGTAPAARAGCLTVEDTGIGISRELLPRLFDMFRQGEVAGKRTSGLGIGLALVRSITELHEGRVWAESEGPGKGSRFSVELPLIPKPEATAPQAPPARAEGVRLLLVEDNPDTRALIAEGLAHLGYRVETTASGEEALDLIRRRPPQVILSDIALPGMDGYALLRQARQLPELAGVPAFAVTGYGREEDVRQAQEAGFTGHFAKPVDVAVIDQRIREQLGARRG
ncbi:MAG: PAS domain S-box protein [Armatimonadetes bacterium]|nr:PAS domain S-box protein [Armatimonadota bacterium]